MTLDLKSVAHALGGEVRSGQVYAPGPGHSAADRSMSVKLSNATPDGFVVHSFSGDDPIVCKDYVRDKLRLEPFQPTNGHRQPRASDDAIAKAMQAAFAAQAEPNSKNIIATYDYRDEAGDLLYQVARLAEKFPASPAKR